MKKKVLSLVLALCMALVLLPGTAFAASSDFTIEDGVLTKYTGSGGAVTIPDSVTAIGGGAFYQCADLTSVTIPDSVTGIGEYAFRGCSRLTSVTIPGSVTEISEGVFIDCRGLTSVTILGNVAAIGESAFQNCTGLTSVTIPDSVTVIGKSAFNNCTGLTSVTIPNSVTEIGEYAFTNCRGLTSVTIPDSVTKVSRSAFYQCTGLTSVTIPDSVTVIDLEAFWACRGLTSVTIPDSVTEIGWAAFWDCTGLTSVTIPSSVTEISEGAFNNCTSLTIYGAAGSYAETYAKENDIPFVADGTSEEPTPGTSTPAFSDVAAGEWYADSVAWAIEKSITNGTSATTFSPARTCSVSEILTFLWRAMDKPAPAGTVTGSEFYASAAQWAQEQGLTDDFNATADCTRAMVVTYLWKLAGSPDVGAADFTDVAADADYAQAVAWAVENEITNGTSATTFAPNDTCTRGQIVTFLYRALG